MSFSINILCVGMPTTPPPQTPKRRCSSFAFFFEVLVLGGRLSCQRIHYDPFDRNLLLLLIVVRTGSGRALPYSRSIVARALFVGLSDVMVSRVCGFSSAYLPPPPAPPFSGCLEHLGRLCLLAPFWSWCTHRRGYASACACEGRWGR